MKRQAKLRFAIIAACLLCSIMASAVTSHKKALLLHPTSAQVDSILNVLDKAIANKDHYHARRMALIDSLVTESKNTHGKERIDILKEAYSYSSHISGKKSMKVLDRLAEVPEYKTDRDLRLWVSDSRAYIFSVMGMFHRSFALMHEAKIESYDRPARAHHYDAYYNILSWAGNAFCEDGSLTAEEKAKMKEYNDSLLTFNRDPVSFAYAKIVNDISKKKYDDALDKLLDLYQKVSGKNETYLYANLCDVFKGRNDVLAMTYYLAKTSVNDIEDGTTEYMCLPILVQTLFEQGDVERAYSYLQCCLEDAYQYPSQYLISQTTNIFPIVDKEYQRKKAESENSRHNMMLFGFFAFFLFFALVGLSIFTHHRRHMMEELQKANDELARSNDDLERANNVKSTFLKNMRHELHTPMNAINGFAQLLDMSDAHIDSAARKEMTSAIRASSHQLNMLIDNIILLTEYDDSRVETKMEKVDINKIFSELSVEVFYAKDDAVKIVYNNNVPDDFVFISSPFHIETILKNLIDNALKFTEQGSVTISAGIDGAHGVVIRVSDTGIGIPEDKRESVFQRFLKLNEFAQGVGLGLPLCHVLTTMLGGKISIDQTGSEGTTITVELPSFNYDKSK